MEVLHHYFVRKWIDGKYHVMERMDVPKQTKVRSLWAVDDKDRADEIVASLNSQEIDDEELREY